MVVRVVAATDELTVDYDDLERQLNERTRVVGFALASNATGSVADAKRICALAREAGALSWIDAVHYAAHEPIDVTELGCDVLICSPYKFCGPHLGLGYVRRELAESWRPYKARPSDSTPSGRRFETGTLPFELLAGFSAAIAYLDSLGGIEPLRDYERALGERFVANLPENVTLYGPPGIEGRVPTFLFNIEGHRAEDVARTLGERGVGIWAAGNWYCVSLATACRSSRSGRGSSTTTPRARSTGCSKSCVRSASGDRSRVVVRRVPERNRRRRLVRHPVRIADQLEVRAERVSK